MTSNKKNRPQIYMSFVIFLIAPLAFDAQIPKNLPLFFISLATFIMVSLSVGTVLGLLIKSSSKLTMVSQLIFLPSIMLGGIMFPASMLPKALQTLGIIFPATSGFKLMTSEVFDAKLLIPLIVIVVVSVSISIYKLSKISLE